MRLSLFVVTFSCWTVCSSKSSCSCPSVPSLLNRVLEIAVHLCLTFGHFCVVSWHFWWKRIELPQNTIMSYSIRELSTLNFTLQQVSAPNKINGALNFRQKLTILVSKCMNKGFDWKFWTKIGTNSSNLSSFSYILRLKWLIFDEDLKMMIFCWKRKNHNWWFN